MTAKEWEDYQQCPQCGNEDIAITLIGFFGDRNPNYAKCYKCGFHEKIEDIPFVKDIKEGKSLLDDAVQVKLDLSVSQDTSKKPKGFV